VEPSAVVPVLPAGVQFAPITTVDGGAGGAVVGDCTGSGGGGSGVNVGVAIVGDFVVGDVACGRSARRNSMTATVTAATTAQQGSLRLCCSGGEGGTDITGRRCVEPVGERAGEVGAPLETVLGILGQRLGQHRVESRRLGALSGDRGRRRGQVLADDDRRVGVLKRRSTGQQVKGGGRQRVLIRPAVELPTHQLLGRSVRNRTDGHVGGGQPADVVHPAGDTEVRQQNSLFARLMVSQQAVGGFDIAV
jgi:hypothetical protein